MNWFRRGAAAAAIEPEEPCLPDIWLHEFGTWGKPSIEETGRTMVAYRVQVTEIHVQWRSCKLCGLLQKRKVNFI